MKKLILTESALKMQKLAGIITESEYKQRLNESWKETIIATALAVSSFLGSAKASNVNTDSTHTSTIKNNGPIKIPMGTYFQSGKYYFDDTYRKEIALKLKQIGDYIKANPNADFEIVIESSESQVTNYDGETANRIKLQPGELAEKRAQVAEFAIDTFMSDLKNKGILKGEAIVKKPHKISIGKTGYRQGENPRQSKFTQEQYVNIIITAIPSTKANTSDIMSAYSTNSDNVFDVNKHSIGHLYYPTRKSKDISVGGMGDARWAHQELLLKMIDNMGKYNGEEYKIPAEWWNKNITYSTLTPEQIQQVKKGDFK